MNKPEGASKNIKMSLLALADFANLGDTPEDLARFTQKHPNFAPFWLKKDLAGGVEVVSPMEASFLPAVLAWRDLLRCVWRGKAQGWELETLLGINPSAYEPWEGTAHWVPLWNQGLEAIHAAGLRFAQFLPRIRARWEAGDFEYEHGEWFEAGVFALWKNRRRARVCPVCESHFVARQKAQKFCSRLCAREGKRESNRRWWRESGPDWRKRYSTEKAKAEKQTKRRKRR